MEPYATGALLEWVIEGLVRGGLAALGLARLGAGIGGCGRRCLNGFGEKLGAE